MNLAIEASGLVKRFGSTTALDGIDLRVPAGTVYGLLGPNGAGKTTTIRILATLARPDAGTARVLGHDLLREPRAVRRRVALTGQFAALDDDLTGRENLTLVGRLLGHPGPAARSRADELLAAFELADAARRQVRAYSGGMRRRLDIAASLVVRPEVLFLDEPTTGLDPHSRAQVWDTVRAIAAAGTTVVLTTQYLDEADRLADRIAVIDHGAVIAEGTSAELKASIGAGSLRLRLADPEQRDQAESVLARSLGTPVRDDGDPAALVATLPGGGTTGATATRALAALADHGIEVSGFNLGQPSLDEVFLTLTGHAARETEEVATA